MTAGGVFSNLFFPRKCPFCGRIGSRKTLEDRGYCDNCAELGFFYSKADGIPHEALDRILRLFVAMRYTGEAKDAMLKYKFGGEEWISDPFSVILHNYLIRNGGYDDVDIITYVPISAKRFAKRGYDQSGLIARRISEMSGLPLRKLLSRDGSTATDTATSARNFALRAGSKRFAAADPGLDLHGAAVLLIDDIFTTGSTLNECGGILLDHGALYVNAACMMSGRQDIYDVAGEDCA